MRYSMTNYSITAAAKGWGPGWPTSRAADMARVTADRSGTGVNVHRRIAVLVNLLLDETERRGYLLDQSQTGAYNSRPISGTNRASNHSWGLALDLNWRRNPVTYTGVPRTDFPAWLVPLWKRYGFAWGGDYSGSFTDAMHFEFMGGPADAGDMTAQALDDFRNQDQGEDMPEPKDLWDYEIPNPASKVRMSAARRLLDVETQVSNQGRLLAAVNAKLDVLTDKLNRTGGAIADGFSDLNADHDRIEAELAADSTPEA